MLRSGRFAAATHYAPLMILLIRMAVDCSVVEVFQELHVLRD
jgi:hypothetical protein